MFARNVRMQLKPNSTAQFTQTLEKEVLPVLRKQEGFQDEVAFVVPGGTEAFAISFWQSKEKADALKAFGAEVIVCPRNVDPEDPRSYYSVSSRLVKEIPNSWKANQYDNLSNTIAHYEQTGPEIWGGTRK